MTPAQIMKVLPNLDTEARQEVLRLVKGVIWSPQAGPQDEAYESKADILFYGGAAGGGKSDLLVGLSLTRHLKSILFRREHKQTLGIVDRMAEIMGSRDGYNGQEQIWRGLADGRQVEFGHCKNLGDETKYMGRPHDLIGFDEITHFLEFQFRFLTTWLRSTVSGQRCRIVCTGNPPTNSDGEWVREYWGAWLNPEHPNPAQPGELRWYSTGEDGKDYECDGPDDIQAGIKPLSRTYIPSKVTDNVFLMTSNYRSVLYALPEPLRSQMLNGDFSAGTDDDPWQVIPTDWVKDAQKRWEPLSIHDRGAMTSMGVDPARGGRDQTVLAPKYGNWFDELLCYPGMQTPDGPAVAGLVVQNLRDRCPVNVDVIGVGSSVYDHLKGANVRAVPVNFASSTKMRDRANTLEMINVRAAAYWKMREDLDPKNKMNIALPPGDSLRADLCCAKWSLRSNGVQIESKDDIIMRLHRSPDEGDAVVLANFVADSSLSAPVNRSRQRRLRSTISNKRSTRFF